MIAVAHIGPALGMVGLAFTGCNQILAVFWITLATTLSGAAYSGYQVSRSEGKKILTLPNLLLG